MIQKTSWLLFHNPQNLLHWAIHKRCLFSPNVLVLYKQGTYSLLDMFLLSISTSWTIDFLFIYFSMFEVNFILTTNYKFSKIDIAFWWSYLREIVYVQLFLLIVWYSPLIYEQGKLTLIKRIYVWAGNFNSVMRISLWQNALLVKRRGLRGKGQGSINTPQICLIQINWLSNNKNYRCINNLYQYSYMILVASYYLFF